MFHKVFAGKSFLNRKEYCDKLLGCWYGKNIGGTLGAPFEALQQFNNVEYYTQELNGNPIPNDDLDLQLIWLRAVENCGVYGINERVLGEYWLAFITLPANEYAIARENMRQGFFPPLSGAVGNEKWKNSNGAWIRSEIWACLFPGAIDEAGVYAWYDACVDHTGDGIYAEIFTATLESAAFIENDREKIIELALQRIPEDCRVARAVRLVCEHYHKKTDWKTLRNLIVEDSKDLGWFQAPANVAFAILGLLYGEGDFGRSICLAVNCGDDTDCTAATCGAVLGILLGRSGIPEKWLKPIGDSIQSISFERSQSFAPQSIPELSRRVLACKEYADATNPSLIRLHEKPTSIDQEDKDSVIFNPKNVPPNIDRLSFFRKRLNRSSLSFRTHLPFGDLDVIYDRVPEVEPGETINLKLVFSSKFLPCLRVTFSIDLPEGWSSPQPVKELFMMQRRAAAQEITLTTGEFCGRAYIPLVLTISDRSYPVTVFIPFRRKGSLAEIHNGSSIDMWDDYDLARVRSSLVPEFTK